MITRLMVKKYIYIIHSVFGMTLKTRLSNSPEFGCGTMIDIS